MRDESLNWANNRKTRLATRKEDLGNEQAAGQGSHIQEKVHVIYYAWNAGKNANGTTRLDLALSGPTAGGSGSPALQVGAGASNLKLMLYRRQRQLHQCLQGVQAVA
jgi:hypothetical protein